MNKKTPCYCNHLLSVTNREWKAVRERLAEFIRRKVGRNTRYGAHSESNLGMPAVDYYLGESFIKLLGGQWRWQEGLTLYEQLERIAGSLISKQVEKFGRLPENIMVVMEPGQMMLLDYCDVFEDDGVSVNRAYELALEITQDDPELKRYVEATCAFNDLDMVCKHLGIMKSKVYNLNRRLIYKIEKWKNYCLTKKEKHNG